jgi:uncharacterized membrane protein
MQSSDSDGTIKKYGSRSGLKRMNSVAFGVALAVHIAAGSAGLLIGPVAMLAAKRPGLHTTSGTAYYYVFVVLFASALTLAALRLSQDWGLALIGAVSYGLALLGYRAAKRRRRGWIHRHVSGMAGSYISMVTAFMVINVNAIGASGTTVVLATVVPPLVGVPVIIWLNFQIAAGRRPKAWREQVSTARRTGSDATIPTA